MTKKIIEQLEDLINKNDTEIFVVGKAESFLIVGSFINLKVHIDKSGNIFQPFGKNILKTYPIFFPLIIDHNRAKLSNLILHMNYLDVPSMHLNNKQIKNYKAKDLETSINEHIRIHFLNNNP